MHKSVLVLPILTAGMCTGCGGNVPSSLPPTSNLHGGILVALPDNRGYVELLNDGGEKKAGVYRTRIVAYLLQSDQKTAFAQQPTSVAVALVLPRESKTVPLHHAPVQSDPLGSARFVSEPGQFELSQIGGEVLVAVDGKTLNGSFRGPR